MVLLKVSTQHTLLHYLKWDVKRNHQQGVLLLYSADQCKYLFHVFVQTSAYLIHTHIACGKSKDKTFYEFIIILYSFIFHFMYNVMYFLAKNFLPHCFICLLTWPLGCRQRVSQLSTPNSHIFCLLFLRVSLNLMFVHSVLLSSHFLFSAFLTFSLPMLCLAGSFWQVMMMVRHASTISVPFIF